MSIILRPPVVGSFQGNAHHCPPGNGSPHRSRVCATPRPGWVESYRTSSLAPWSSGKSTVSA
jgi:hypothetical protein